MFRTLNLGTMLHADDVFHHWSNCREITREEALAAAGFHRVVVVFRNGPSDCADWFEPDHPFFCGFGPHSLLGARYYRYIQRVREKEVGGSASGAAPPARVNPPPPTRRATAPPVEKKTWVAIELLDDKGIPVGAEPYSILLPDGSTQSGTLDAQGRARVDGIDPGTCEVSFPRIDQREWKAVG
jgi:hypothetical protein